ncbi:MAG: hypothetical protein KME30_29085 [Iphinoe sp. HA4291-MV1]|jgi:hypothetical protein|nr:hypothetical protein [Iphinoe sp. HA4291-MV1]
MKERPLTEALLAVGETIADHALVLNDWFEAFPVVNIALKLCKAASNTSDEILMAKLKKFLEEFNQASPKELESFKRKMERNPKEVYKIGEVLVLTLDRISDLDKSKIIGIIFRAYMSELITSAELRRMVEAINLAFVDDLKAFLDEESASRGFPKHYLRYLSSTGLTEITTGKTIDEAGEIDYEITELGRKLKKAYRYATLNHIQKQVGHK